MKIVKLNKTMLKKGWVHILKAVGAVEGNQAYPSHVYMAKEDIKAVRKNYREELKKERPGISKKYLDYYEGIDFLNYGANSSAENVIKPGCILVDIAAIEREIKYGK
jgi:hypothetical protein